MPKKYPQAIFTVDNVVFSVINDALKILLIKRGGEPFKNHWAFPGGFVEISQGESPEVASSRELKEETKLDSTNCFMEQLQTFANGERDPRGYTVTVAYLVVCPPDLTDDIEGMDDAIAAQWFHVYTPLDEEGNEKKEEDWVGDLDLAFDHQKILEIAIARLEYKLKDEYRMIFTFLPKEFTQIDMRTLFEVIKLPAGETYSRQAFSRRFEKLLREGKIETTGSQRIHGQGRPHKYYHVSQAFLEEDL